jgi:hypothetical protein
MQRRPITEHKIGFMGPEASLTTGAGDVRPARIAEAFLYADTAMKGVR